MAKFLVLDLDVCGGCGECSVRCDYFWRANPAEAGVHALREEATFLLSCRRCEHASCAAACPTRALERRADGLMIRHDLRCVSCESCVAACPFGTILPELVAFYTVPCDRCAGRADEAGPLCTRSCERGAVAWRDVATGEPDLHVLSGTLAVRAPRWVPEEAEGHPR